MMKLLPSPKALAYKKLLSQDSEIASVACDKKHRAFLRNDSFNKQEGQKRCGSKCNDRFNVDIRPWSRGQSLIEFALLLPVFLLAVVVVFDLGRAIYYYSAVHNAAREGARYGIVHPTDTTGMKNKAINYAIGLGLTTANVTAGLGTPETIGGIANPTVKVTVTYSFSPATPLLDLLLPSGTINLKSVATMRTEVLP